MIKLKDYKGIVYDLSYENKEKVYNNTEEFINDICNIEISLAIQDCPLTYANDEFYIKYKEIKENQEISLKELNYLLDSYDYNIE